MDRPRDIFIRQVHQIVRVAKSMTHQLPDTQIWKTIY